jgi:hypothetical protein
VVETEDITRTRDDEEYDLHLLPLPLPEVTSREGVQDLKRRLSRSENITDYLLNWILTQHGET